MVPVYPSRSLSILGHCCTLKQQLSSAGATCSGFPVAACCLSFHQEDLVMFRLNPQPTFLSYSWMDSMHMRPQHFYPARGWMRPATNTNSTGMPQNYPRQQLVHDMNNHDSNVNEKPNGHSTSTTSVPLYSESSLSARLLIREKRRFVARRSANLYYITQQQTTPPQLNTVRIEPC